MARSGQKTARKPATKFAHLQKKLRKNKLLGNLRGKWVKKK